MLCDIPDAIAFLGHEFTRGWILAVFDIALFIVAVAVFDYIRLGIRYRKLRKYVLVACKDVQDKFVIEELI